VEQSLYSMNQDKVPTQMVLSAGSQQKFFVSDDIYISLSPFTDQPVHMSLCVCKSSVNYSFLNVSVVVFFNNFKFNLFQEKMSIQSNSLHVISVKSHYRSVWPPSSTNRPKELQKLTNPCVSLILRVNLIFFYRGMGLKLYAYFA